MNIDEFVEHILEETLSTYGSVTVSNVDKFLDRYCGPLLPSEYIKVMIKVGEKIREME